MKITLRWENQSQNFRFSAAFRDIFSKISSEARVFFVI